jgi:hypothetical protein
VTSTRLTGALLAAYRRTRYAVGDVVVRIGRRSRQVDALLTGQREGVLITAWNPRSRLMPPGWNRRLQLRLLERVRSAGHGAAVEAAMGADRRWSEDHLLLLMPAVKAATLGRRFRQNAIVVLRRGQRARLLVL